MQADAESGKVRGLYLAVKECFSLAAGQFNINVRLDSMERSSRMPALTHSNRSLTVAWR